MALAACGRPQPDPPATKVVAEVWQANSRDRLCLDGNRAGFIVYGEGDANCAARGRAIRSDSAASIVPDGDRACVFRLIQQGDQASLRASPVEPGGCDYYCAPGAALGEIGLTRAPAGTPANDLAGDPLC